MANDDRSETGCWVPHPFALFAKEPALSEGERVGAMLPGTTVFVG